MRIALIDTHACGAGEFAGAVWRGVSPGDELRIIPLSDGGESLARALSANPPPDQEIWLAGAQWCRGGGTALENASSREIGQALISALEIAGPGAEIFLGLPGEAGFHDGGAGALAELLAWVSQRPISDYQRLLNGGAGLHQVTRADLPATVIGELISIIRSVRLNVACADPTPARGLHGAGATLARSGRVSEQRAQELDVKVGAFWRQLRRAISASRVSLALNHSGGSDPYERAPFSGCAGALAGMLAMCGAHMHDGAALLCQRLPLATALEDADVAVMVTDEVGAPPSLIVHAVAQAVEPFDIPLVALAGQVSAAQHEWAQIGISEVRSVIDPYRRRALGPVAGYRPPITATPPATAPATAPATYADQAGPATDADQAGPATHPDAEGGAASSDKKHSAPAADEPGASYLMSGCWVEAVGVKKFANRVKALARAWGTPPRER